MAANTLSLNVADSNNREVVFSNGTGIYIVNIDGYPRIEAILESSETITGKCPFISLKCVFR